MKITTLFYTAALAIAVYVFPACNQAPEKATVKTALEDSTDTEANRLLPKKLRTLPYGLFGAHDPNPTYADFEDSMYVWKHNTTVQSVVGDLEIEEYGSYVWTDAGWYLRVSYTAKDFETHYACPGGKIKAGVVYTDPMSWRRQETLSGGDAMWYYIAKDKDGKRWKGIALIETEGKLREVANDTNAFQFSSERSRVGWTGYAEVGVYQLSGTVPVLGGWCRWAGGLPGVGELTINMKGMKNPSADLIQHLNSEDFFYTEKYPEAKFVLNSSVAQGKDSVELRGQLTLRGATQSISCMAAVSRFDNECRIVGSIVLDRTQFGIKYGSTSFFGNLGDQAIRNTMRIEFYLAGKQEHNSGS